MATNEIIGRNHFIPIESIEPSVLKERLQEKGIEVIIFDLDDTLIYTGQHFKQAIDDFCQIFSRLTDIDYTLVRSDFVQFNLQAFSTYSVLAERWQAVVWDMIKKHCIDKPELFKDIKIASELFDDLYQTPFQIRPGVIQVINALTEANVPFFIATHAIEEWTYFKLAWLGALNLQDNLFIVPPEKHKDPEQWGIIISEIEQRTGIQRDKYFVNGDNIKGDLIASREAGIPQQGWVTNAGGYEVNGSLPKGTVVGESVYEILGKLLAA